MITLGEALPKEIERVRKLIVLYEDVPMGRIAAARMRKDVIDAQQAINSGDLAAMITSYSSLKEWQDD